MTFRAHYISYTLKFKFPAGTSRGVLLDKRVFFLILEKNGRKGVGECSVIPGLSTDDHPDYENRVRNVCERINLGENPENIEMLAFPSIAFGLETAWTDWKNGGNRLLFPGDFTEGLKGIYINGLVWMGNKEFMEQQIRQKLEAGFRCIKLKIGALDFENEIEILKNIRTQYPESDLEIRLDANGAFGADQALEKLKRLSDYKIHSIEQPIKAGQWPMMAAICRNSPIPVVLDEELIGIVEEAQQDCMLRDIKPAYIILKPGLLGGLKVSEKWIQKAEDQHIGWWATSALESNIGLNAIAQWTSAMQLKMPQGLGTGMLYTNNIGSPLTMVGNQLFYNPAVLWDLTVLNL